MAFVTCPGCGLKHTSRPDGFCPRCHNPLGALAMSSEPSLASLLGGASDVDLVEACEMCGARGPTRPVTFRQNIGALIMRFHRTVKGRLCERCVQRYFYETTGITLAIGWLGLISLVMAPIYIIQNLAEYSNARAAFRRRPGAGLAVPAASRPPDARMAVVSFVLGLLSVVFCPVFVLAPVAFILGIVALVRVRRNPATHGGRLFAIGGIVTSVVSVLLLALVVRAILREPVRPTDPAEAAFDAADARVNAAREESVMGNTTAARAMAADVNGFCNDLGKLVKTYDGDKGSSILETPCATYVEARAGKVCFLVHVPDLRRYSDAEVDSILDLFWVTARAAAKKSYGQDDVRIGLGLRGVLLYGATAVGKASAEKAMVRDRTTSSSPSMLHEFFGGPLVADVPAASPAPAVAPSAPRPEATSRLAASDGPAGGRPVDQCRTLLARKEGRSEKDRLAMLGTYIGVWSPVQAEEVLRDLSADERGRLAADVGRIVQQRHVKDSLHAVVVFWISVDRPAAKAYLLNDADLRSTASLEQSALVDGLLRLGVDADARMRVRERLGALEKSGNGEAHRALEILGLVPTDRIESMAKKWRTDHTRSTLTNFHSSYLQYVPPGTPFDAWRLRLGEATAHPTDTLYEYSSADNAMTVRVRLDANQRIAEVVKP